jgi:hypothetical protein
MPAPISVWESVAALQPGNVTITAEYRGFTDSSHITVLPSEAAQWTFMVYLCSDNNLEYFDFIDIKEMEMVGSTDQVNVIVQWDRTGNDTSVDWGGCRRYYIVQGDDDNQVYSHLVQDMGDVNMGSESVLLDFIQWGKSAYPANKYAVVLWNHGAGWRENQLSGEIHKGICYDDTSNDHLTESELKSAFLQATNYGQDKIELIGMDACLMATTETAYNLKDTGKYFAASETMEPGNGWPYHSILTQLTTNPEMNGAVLGSSIVNGYADYYSSFNNLNFSAIDLSKMDSLAQSIDIFAQYANTVMTQERAILIEAKNETLNFYYLGYRDLGDFMGRVSEKTSDSILASYADSVNSALSQAVVDNYAGSSVPNSTGLTVWLPYENEYLSWQNYYYDLNFSVDTNWDEFLQLLLDQ